MRFSLPSFERQKSKHFGEGQWNGSEDWGYTNSQQLQKARQFVYENNFAKAVAAFQKGQKQLFKKYGSDTALATSLMQEIAFTNYRWFKFSEAVLWYQRCLAVYENNPDAFRREIPHVTLMLAGCHQMLGNKDEILRLHASILKAAEEGIYDDKAQFTAMTGLASYHSLAGRMQEAILLYEQAVFGFENAAGPYNRDALLAKEGLGFNLMLSGRYNEAETVYKEAIAAYEASLGPKSLETLNAHEKLGNLYEHWERLPGAEAELSKYLIGLKNLPKHNTFSLKIVADRLVKVYSKQGKDSQGEDVLRWVRGESTTLPYFKRSAMEYPQPPIRPKQKGKRIMGFTDLERRPSDEYTYVYERPGGDRSDSQSEMSHSHDNTEIFYKGISMGKAPEIGSSSKGKMIEKTPRVGDDSEVYNREIKIQNAHGDYKVAVALLDTQCQSGNWVSKRLIEELHLSSHVSSDFSPPELLSATGHGVEAFGVIDLVWKWHPRGTRIHRGTFFIFPTSSHLDVLFGVDYIVREGLVSVNEGTMAPLTEHRKFKKSDKAAIALAEAKQKQDKQALAARRAAAQQQQQQQQQASPSASSQASFRTAVP